MSTQLLESCRVLRGLLSKRTTHSALFLVPGLAEALPHVRELIAGVEDLNDRLALVEAALRTINTR